MMMITEMIRKMVAIVSNQNGDDEDVTVMMGMMVIMIDNLDA